MHLTQSFYHSLHCNVLQHETCILSLSHYRTPKDVYDNGGDWLIGVHLVGHNTDNQTGNLIGFIHAEDHFYDPESGFPPGTHYAFKSIALGMYMVYCIKR